MKADHERPPRWADRLLAWFCAPHLLEEIQGDLYERFARRTALTGVRKARRQYGWEVLGFLTKPFAWTRQPISAVNWHTKPGPSTYSLTLFPSPDMLRNYVQIALRNQWKQKLFSAINVFGLASGLTVCLLAIAHTKVAFEYDRFHPSPSQTYRILTDVVGKDNQTTAFATSPMPLANLLKQNYGLIEKATRLVQTNGEFLGNKKHLSIQAFAVDPDFFSLFGYRLAKGQPATEPHTAVLTRHTAERFFGTANPIGNVLQHNELGPLVITGILAENPGKSHLTFDLLLSLKTPTQNRKPAFLQDWKQYYNGYTYVQLKPGLGPKTLEKLLKSVAVQATKGLPFLNEKGYSLRAQALTQISPAREQLVYATSELPEEKLLIELSVGLITLLLAAFNYINLTLARSLSRAREVGIRKVAGSLRWQLMAQFMTESVVLSLLALGLSVVMLEVIRPMAFVQKWMDGGVHWDALMVGICIVFCVLTGLLAGFLPARVLSGFQPAQVLRSQTGLRIFKGITLRKSLTIIQFSISLIAMIGLSTMNKQFTYMATADYGFERHHRFTIPLKNAPYQQLAQEINHLAGVKRTAASSALLGQKRIDQQLVRRLPHAIDSSLVCLLAIDTSFIKTMGLSLIAGTNLPALATDSSGRFVLVNEEALRTLKLGTSTEAIGQLIWLNDSTSVHVAGVLKNFRFMTLAKPIQPLLLRYQPRQFQYLTVDVASGQTSETTLSVIRQLWEQLNPYEPFEGQWYDDFLYHLHNPTEDTDFLSLLIGFTFSIACLGLLGIVTYTTEIRTKEVGVRKVLGATVSQLVWLLSRDFVKLLLIAGGIALPLGYLIGSAFLASFAFRVSLGADTLGLCFGILMLLGSLTIGWRTYLKASSNPVKSLQTE